MISYVTFGADDIARTKQFYDAFLPALGYMVKEGPDGLGYTLPEPPLQRIALPAFYIKPTFDGRPASSGNGTMIAFEARNQQQVRDLHAAALASGGSDEGQPGFRASYGPRFYVGYLRDPQGNKIALFSENPNEPERDG
jgi:catechol 2,3-dioxygenase-like lactoylglutathione lyase family enzyme